LLLQLSLSPICQQLALAQSSFYSQTMGFSVYVRSFNERKSETKYCGCLFADARLENNRPSTSFERLERVSRSTTLIARDRTYRGTSEVRHREGLALSFRLLIFFALRQHKTRRQTTAMKMEMHLTYTDSLFHSRSIFIFQL